MFSTRLAQTIRSIQEWLHEFIAYLRRWLFVLRNAILAPEGHFPLDRFHRDFWDFFDRRFGKK
jgi:hypothetical protein